MYSYVLTVGRVYLTFLSTHVRKFRFQYFLCVQFLFRIVHTLHCILQNDLVTPCILWTLCKSVSSLLWRCCLQLIPALLFRLCIRNVTNLSYKNLALAYVYLPTFYTHCAGIAQLSYIYYVISLKTSHTLMVHHVIVYTMHFAPLAPIAHIVSLVRRPRPAMLPSAL
jgi:hypothetical protein